MAFFLDAINQGRRAKASNVCPRRTTENVNHPQLIICTLLSLLRENLSKKIQGEMGISCSYPANGQWVQFEPWDRIPTKVSTQLMKTIKATRLKRKRVNGTKNDHFINLILFQVTVISSVFSNAFPEFSEWTSGVKISF